MKKIIKVKLEVIKPGMPNFSKQSIEISAEGYLKQCLHPMVYLGQMKMYEYSIEKKDVEQFFSTLDIENWTVNRKKASLNISFNLKVFYENNEMIEDFGYIHETMPKEYQLFDENLLELVLFIEQPWLFTV
jgi:hypothetical protein